MDCCEIEVGQGRSHASSALSAAPMARRSRSCLMVIACTAGAAVSAWPCRSMSAMGSIPMPGGWSMSAMWSPMCGQTWLGAAMAFVGMWTWMMAAMTLPLSAPGWRHFSPRRGPPGSLVARSSAAVRVGLLAATSGSLAWGATGAIVFAFGHALAASLPHTPTLARFVPLVQSVAVITAGTVQFTPWKARRLTRCRCDEAMRFQREMAPIAVCKWALLTAFQEGGCCANLMAALLFTGVMDPRAMAGASAAMAIERLAPADSRAAHGIGIVIVCTGLYQGTRTVLALSS